MVSERHQSLGFYDRKKSDHPTLHTYFNDHYKTSILLRILILRYRNYDVPFACISPVLGLSGGAMLLGKLPVPGRPTNLDYIMARAYCACRRCGWRLFGHFFSLLSFLSSFSISLESLWETTRYRLNTALEGC